MIWGIDKFPPNKVRLAQVLCCVIVGSTLFYQTGCNKGSSSKTRYLATEYQARDEFATHVDNLFEQYIEGNADQAFRALNEITQFAQNSKINVGVRAHVLWLAYARLYVFEMRANNQNAAEADLVKARYWYLRRLEERGDSPEEAGKAVQSMTGEKCEKIMTKWDRDVTKGKGPKYLYSQAATTRSGETIPSSLPAVPSNSVAQPTSNHRGGRESF